MSNIEIKLENEQIHTALQNGFVKALENSYSNPFTKIVDEAFKAKAVEMKKIVDEAFSETLNSPKFKEKIGEAIFAKLVESSLKR
jgi:hypothetical protein